MARPSNLGGDELPLVSKRKKIMVFLDYTSALGGRQPVLRGPSGLGRKRSFWTNKPKKARGKLVAMPPRMPPEAIFIELNPDP